MEHLERTITQLEGKLFALQRITLELVKLLPEADHLVLMEWIKDRIVLQDGQEDPGAVPFEVAAAEAAKSQEFQLIYDLLRRENPSV